MVDTALLVVVSPALFHTVLSVVASVAEALVAEAHHVFLSVVVIGHSFCLRILTLLLSKWHDTGLLLSVLTPVSCHLLESRVSILKRKLWLATTTLRKMWCASATKASPC